MANRSKFAAVKKQPTNQEASKAAHIALFELEDWEKRELQEGQLGSHSLILSDDSLRSENSELNGESLTQAEVISVFIHSAVDRKVLDAFPRLRSIATRSTGFDHIDMAACKERGVVVSNVPSYGENTVAEHTFALILALSRNIHKAFVHTLSKTIPFDQLRGFDLAGKTIGVIGAGRIGLHVIKMARGFGMNVVAYDVRQEPLLAEVLNFRYVPFEELLKSSDVVTLHCPYTKQNHHLINTENIRLIKPGALLINTARGGLVDPEALMQALNEGILAGAGLDVLEGEELLQDEREILSRDLAQDRLRTLVLNHALLERDNVVITPHIAFNSREAVHRILETTVANIQAFLDGKPQNVVGS